MPGHRGRGWAGGFEFGRGGPGWPGGGRLFAPGDMKFVVLRLLQDKPMHGYEVMKALEERSQGCYKASPGTVYPTLQWLEEEDLVGREGSGSGKKIYSITAAGAGFLGENQAAVEDIFERMDDMADFMSGSRLPEVGQAVGRLVREAFRTAWRSRERDTASAVVGILEKARREVRELRPGSPSSTGGETPAAEV